MSKPLCIGLLGKASSQSVMGAWSQLTQEERSALMGMILRDDDDGDMATEYPLINADIGSIFGRGEREKTLFA